MTTGVASSAQQRLWMDEKVRFDQSTNEQISVYNELLIYTLLSNTSLSIHQLSQALSLIISKHPVLRTALFYEQEQLIQKVSSTTPDLCEINITNLANDDHLNQILYDEETNRTLFSLEHGRVFRCHLLRFSCNDNDRNHLEQGDMIVFNFHHVAIDGNSIPIFVDDLREALTAQKLPYDSENDISYLDYAQHERLEDWSDARFYWSNVLDAFSHSINEQESFVRTGKGHTVTFQLDHDLTIKLNRFISQSKSTLFQIGLAAFFAFLFKMSNSNQTDLCTNIVVMNRPHYHLQNVMGFFSNTLPFFVKIDPHSSFAQLCHQIQKHWLNLLPHSHLPYQEIVRLNPQMRSSLLQTLFVVETMRDNADQNIMVNDSTKLTMTDRGLLAGNSSKFGMVCTLSENRRDETIAVSLNASLDVYDPSTLSNMANRLKQIFEQIFSVSSLYQFNTLLSHELKLVRDLNTNSLETSEISCAHWDFADQAIRYPQKIASVIEHSSLTYAEVLYHSQLLANRLITEYAVQPGDRIGQLIERSFERVIGMISIWMSGGVYIPLNPHDSVKQISTCIRQSDAHLLLVHHSTHNLSLAQCSVLGVHVNHIVCPGEVNQEITSNVDSVDVTPEHLSHILFTHDRPDMAKLVRNYINR